MDRTTENVCLTLKVAARFAARPMKPEKMTELLMKLRKGAGTSLQMKNLDPVFAFLGGWKIDEVTLLVPDYPYPANHVRSFGDEDPAVAQRLWEAAKHNEVGGLPGTGQVKLNHKYYLNVSDLVSNPNRTFPTMQTFTAIVWEGATGFRIIAPNHKTLDIAGSYEEFLNAYASNKGVFEWLKKETPFYDQINEKLGLESYEAQRQKAQALKIRDNTGTCPCCFRNIKLTPRAKKGSDKSMPGMTLHGYKRPGFGYIHGNCFGEDWAPFELSNDGSVAYLKKLDEWIEFQEAHLHELKTDKVKLLRDGDKTVRREVAEPHAWERLVKEAIDHTQYGLKEVKREHADVKKRSDAWKLEPLPFGVSPAL